MSQAGIWNVPLAGPGTMAAFAGRVSPSFDALLTAHSGASRPAYAVANTIWLNVVSASQVDWYYFDGANDIKICTFNPLADSITLNANALGFDVTTIARSDQATQNMCNSRMALKSGVNSEGLLRLKGTVPSTYDASGIVWSKGNDDSTLYQLLSQISTNSIRLLDGSNAEALRFQTDGDIVSKLWNKLSDQLVPPGMVVAMPFSTAPTGWVIADGSLLARVGTYARLWGYAQSYGLVTTEATWARGYYGYFSSGDLSTTFRIPSLTNNTFIRCGIGTTWGLGYQYGNYIQDHGHSYLSNGNSYTRYADGNVYGYGYGLWGDHTHPFSAGFATGAGGYGASGNLCYSGTSSTGAMSTNGYNLNHVHYVEQQAGSNPAETTPRAIAWKPFIKY